jgi:hypothetical protein
MLDVVEASAVVETLAKQVPNLTDGPGHRDQLARDAQVAVPRLLSERVDASIEPRPGRLELIADP